MLISTSTRTNKVRPSLRYAFALLALSVGTGISFAPQNLVSYYLADVTLQAANKQTALVLAEGTLHMLLPGMLSEFGQTINWSSLDQQAAAGPFQGSTTPSQSRVVGFGDDWILTSTPHREGWELVYCTPSGPAWKTSIHLAPLLVTKWSMELYLGCTDLFKYPEAHLLKIDCRTGAITVAQKIASGLWRGLWIDSAGLTAVLDNQVLRLDQSLMLKTEYKSHGRIIAAESVLSGTVIVEALPLRSRAILFLKYLADFHRPDWKRLLPIEANSLSVSYSDTSGRLLVANERRVLVYSTSGKLLGSRSLTGRVLTLIRSTAVVEATHGIVLYPIEE